MNHFCKIYLVCLLLPVALSAQLGSYKFSGQKAAGLGLAVIGGIGTGMNHAYHADARIFEKKWGVAPASFFGSQAWRRNYRNMDVEQGRKWGPNIHRDVWHASSAVATWGKISAAVVVTVGEKRRHWSHYVIDAVIVGAAYGVSSHLTYSYLR